MSPAGFDPLPEAIRAAIGGTSLPWRYEVTTTAIRAYARAAGYTDLVYFDAERARASGYRDLPAPPGFLGTPVYVPEASDEVFSEPSFGQPHVPHDLERAIDAGTDTEHFEQLCAGDVLFATTRIADIRPSNGAQGGGLLILRETTFVDERTGAVVARQRRSTLHCRSLPWG